MSRIKVASGTQLAYDNLYLIDSETFYVCTDTRNIYLGVNLIYVEDIFKTFSIDDYNNVVITTYGDLGTTVVSFSNYNNTYDVLKAIESAISVSYKFIRNINSGDITSALLTSSNYRDAYCVNYGFIVGDESGQVSNSLFADDAQNKSYPADSYIAVINTGTQLIPVYKFTVLNIGGSGGGGGGVKPDWDAVPGSPAEILNKPTALSDFTNDMGFTDNIGTITGITMNGVNKGTSGIVDLGYIQSEITEQNKLSADLISDGTNNKVFTTSDKIKLDGIESGAEANVQSDWEELDVDSDSYIKNKPLIPDGLNWEEF